MTEVSALQSKWHRRGVRSAFLGRVPGVEVTEDKWETLARLEPSHRESVASLGFEWKDLWRAEQVHGCEVREVPPAREGRVLEGVDGLMTRERGVLLGIYVADCAAVSLVDCRSGALALVHAGRKGAEGGIVAEAVDRMAHCYGTRGQDLEVNISPCIRPPHFEIDFVALIQRQLQEVGVPREQVVDTGISTAEHVDRYYSYRVEKGKTGRMLALLGWHGKEGA